MKMNVYLNFPGNTEEAFNFYRSVFGGEYDGFINRYKDGQGMGEVPPADMEKILHISLPIGDNFILHGSDALASMNRILTLGNNVYLFIDAASRQEADEFFRQLSEGGSVEMAMADMFWGAYYGSLTDRFGVHWMINHQFTEPPSVFKLP